MMAFNMNLQSAFEELHAKNTSVFLFLASTG